VDRLRQLVMIVSLVLLLGGVFSLGPPGTQAAPVASKPTLVSRNHTYVMWVSCATNQIQKAGHTTSSYIHTLAPVRMMTYAERSLYCYRR
jgi:hypothetical protein